MIQRVGHWPLKKFFRRGVQRFRPYKIIVEAFQGVEEALHFVRPGQRLRIMPGGLPLGHRESPIKEVADMCQDLDGCARILSGLKIDKSLRGVSQSLAAPVGDCGERMAKEFSSGNAFVRHAE